MLIYIYFDDGVLQYDSHSNEEPVDIDSIHPAEKWDQGFGLRVICGDWWSALENFMEIIGQKSTLPGNLLNIKNYEYSVYFGMMIDHESRSTSN